MIHESRRLFNAQDGMALIDVVIASVILMVVFLPLSTLLVVSTGIIGSDRQTVVAESVAAGQLSNVRAMATSSSNWTVTSPSPSVLTLPSAGTTTVSGATFNYSFKGGWCAVVSAAPPALSNGTTTGNNPYVYYVQVHVTWATTSNRPGSIDVGSEVSTMSSATGTALSGVVAPSSATTPTDATACPV